MRKSITALQTSGRSYARNSSAAARTAEVLPAAQAPELARQAEHDALARHVLELYRAQPREPEERPARVAAGPPEPSQQVEDADAADLVDRHRPQRPVDLAPVRRRSRAMLLGELVGREKGVERAHRRIVVKVPACRDSPTRRCACSARSRSQGSCPTAEQLQLAEILDTAGFAYLEISGGGCFDSAVRRGVESPWERIRAIRARTKTPLAMALRGRFLVGSRPVNVDLAQALRRLCGRQWDRRLPPPRPAERRLEPPRGRLGDHRRRAASSTPVSSTARPAPKTPISSSSRRSACRSSAPRACSSTIRRGR